MVGPSFFLDFFSHSNSRVPKPYLSSIPKGIFELKKPNKRQNNLQNRPKTPFNWNFYMLQIQNQTKTHTS
jgi:hypothetical protein